MLCAALPDKHASAWDSGGPLVTDEGGYSVLIGVVSWGRQCLDPTGNYPGVYARVTSQLEWILEHISGTKCPRPNRPRPDETKTCECGPIDKLIDYIDVDYIGGGKEAKEHAHPWQVSLFRNDNDFFQTHLDHLASYGINLDTDHWPTAPWHHGCGGSIISHKETIPKN